MVRLIGGDCRFETLSTPAEYECRSLERIAHKAGRIVSKSLAFESLPSWAFIFRRCSRGGAVRKPMPAWLPPRFSPAVGTRVPPPACATGFTHVGFSLLPPPARRSRVVGRGRGRGGGWLGEARGRRR